MSTTAPVHPERNRGEPPVRPEPVEGRPLCQHLPLIAAAPGGIKKLRELILELAVRGKLMQQDPEDEPASELLERIQAERLRMEEADVLKKATPLQINEDDKPYDIPVGWTWVRLGGLLSKIGAGSTPLGGKKAYVSEGMKFLRSQNVWDEGLRLSGVALIPPVIHQKMSGTHVQAGDLLFNITGASIGRCALVPDDFDVANVSQHVSIIRPIDADTRFFLHKLLISRYVQKAVMDVQVGVSREGLSIRKLSQFVIPLPPLTEQHRIVAKVDELMALCDRLEAQQTDVEAAHATLVKTLLDTLTQGQTVEDFHTNWQRLSAHFDTLFTIESSIDALKQTVLQLAVMGKLVSQNTSDEPAGELLKRIEAEKTRLVVEGKIKRERPLPEISTAEVPYQLPSSWQWVRLGELCDLITSGSRDWAKYYAGSGAIFVRMGNLSRSDYRLRLGSIQHVKPPQGGEGTRTKLEEGDLLVSVTGEVGLLGLIPASFGDAYINQHTCLIRLNRLVRSVYFPNVLRSATVREQFDAPQRGIKNSFRLSDVAEMLVPLSPLAEQHCIVARLDELMVLCDALKQRLGEARTLQQRLTEILVEQGSAAQQNRLKERMKTTAPAA